LAALKKRQYKIFNLFHTNLEEATGNKLKSGQKGVQSH
jgi:hypothetical protein